MYPGTTPRRTRPDARAYGAGLSGYLQRLADQRQDVADEYGSVRDVYLGDSPAQPRRSPGVSALARAGGGGVGDPALGYTPGAPISFDSTEQQGQRLNYEAGLDAFQNARIDRNLARDPGVRLYREQQDRERALADAAAGRTSAALDTAAADTRAIDSFHRLEPLRLAKSYEDERLAERMLPYNPAYQQSSLKYQGTLDTNDARVAAAQAAAGARVGAGAMSSLARVGSAPTFSPEDAARVDAAAQAIRPNVPGQANAPGAGATALRPLPPEWDFSVLVTQRFGGDAAAAERWLNANGYRSK